MDSKGSMPAAIGGVLKVSEGDYRSPVIEIDDGEDGEVTESSGSEFEDAADCESRLFLILSLWPCCSLVSSSFL